MKYYGKWLLSIFCMLVLIPVLPLLGFAPPAEQAAVKVWDNDKEESQSTVTLPEEAEQTTEGLETWLDKEEEISVYDHETGKVFQLPVLEYIKRVVCAEMPVSFEEEAIKAQAVIAHTYMLRICQNERVSPTEALQGAMISTDSSKHQAYLSEKEIQKLYGTHYDEYWEKVSRCVEEVFDQVLIYENEPIIAAFHAISTGKTETAEHVWGTAVPYLTVTESEGDLYSPQYSQKQRLTVEEVKHILQEHKPDIKLNDHYAQWFTDPVFTESGYVDQIAVLGESMTGQEIREMFLLKSAGFSVEYEEGEFIFTTKGYGHGVGLSQYGANYLARQGENYQDILMHYYPNTILYDAK